MGRDDVELLDVVDAGGRAVGQATREAVHRDGLWHRGVHVLLFTAQGQLLVQTRASSRSQAANALDCSVSEHVRAGETYAQAAVRGLHEELGLPPLPLRRLARFRLDYGAGDNMVGEVFEGTVDAGAVRAEPGEVASVSYHSLVELRRLPARGEVASSRWFAQVLLWYLRQPSCLDVVQDARDEARKRLLLGTKNPARVAIVRAALLPLPVDILTPADLGITIDVAEDGRSIEENAACKARAYFAASHVATLAIDAGLTVEGFAPEKQPGQFVRRAMDHRRPATDAELVEYFAGELARAGGERPGTWHGALALMVAPERLFADTYSFRATFTPKRGRPAGPGAPLDALKVDPATGRYFSETPDDERPDLQPLFAFVRAHIDDW